MSVKAILQDLKDIFEAEYGITTNKEIWNAYQAGKTVIAKHGSFRFNLHEATVTLTLALFSINSGLVIKVATCIGDVWDNSFNYTTAVTEGTVMSGPLKLASDPTEDLHAATKLYVDNHAGKRYASIVIGTSTAGWTEADCDYLCDGVDDLEEILAAINLSSVSNQSILLLDGVYNISLKILLKSNIVITGTKNAILKQTSGENFTQYNNALLYSTYADLGNKYLENVTIENISIELNSDSLKSTKISYYNGGIYLDNRYLSGAGNIVLRKLRIKDTGTFAYGTNINMLYAITVRNISNVTIEECSINNLCNGICVSGHNTSIKNNSLIGICMNSGILAGTSYPYNTDYLMTDINISGNFIEASNNPYYACLGIYIAGGKDIIISNNNIQKSFSRGISLQLPEDYICALNIINGASEGISISNSTWDYPTRGIINDNHVTAYGTPISLSSHEQSRVNRDGSHTIIQGNYLTSTSTWGAKIVALRSISNVTIINNYCKALTTASLVEGYCNADENNTPGHLMIAFNTLINITSEFIDTFYSYNNEEEHPKYIDVAILGNKFNDNENVTNIANFTTGTYTGTGVYGTSNKNSITFDFIPKLVIIKSHTTGLYYMVRIFYGDTTATYNTAYSSTQTLQITWDGNTLSWHGNSAAYLLNTNNAQYDYYAIK